MGKKKFGDETRAVLHRALDIVLLNLGPDAENVGAANNHLGGFNTMSGEFVQARRFFNQRGAADLHQGTWARASYYIRCEIQPPSSCESIDCRSSLRESE